MTLQVPYSTWENVQVPCSQFDADTDPHKDDESLCRCKPKGGAAGAPYGYRTKQEKMRKCCRSKEIPIYSTTGNWMAAEKGSEWSVEMEFGVEDVKRF